MFLKFAYKILLSPKAKSEEGRRREFILNILIVSGFLMLSVALFLRILDIFFPVVLGSDGSFSFFYVLASWLAFVGFILFSRLGFSRFIAVFTVLFYYALATYLAYNWGVEQMSVAVFYLLLIVMSGILVGTGFAFLATAIVVFTLNSLFFLEYRNFTSPDYYWKLESWDPGTAVLLSSIFFLVAAISWLSNREISASLSRAKNSEAALKKERDSLEEKVVERTKDLEKAHTEKMTQMYRFAEFGRLSGGLFHDLINPLTVISLNMEEIKSSHIKEVGEAKHHLDRAIEASHRMEEFIMSIRRQMSKQENKREVSVDEEMKHAIDILSFKTKHAGVEIDYKCIGESLVYTEPTKVSQVLTNLLTNAIDSYHNKELEKNSKIKRKIIIRLEEEEKNLNLSIKDFGVGISEDKLSKIFLPFYTTKESMNGMGIGLSLVKRIIEDDCEGEITVKSKIGKGTTFKILTPKQKIIKKYA